MKWGLITGMLYVVYMLLPNVLGLQQGPGASMGVNLMLGTLILLATFFTIYMGVKETRDEEKNGFITLGEAFKVGLQITLYACVIAGIFGLINYYFIDPNFGDKILEGAEAQWDKMNVPEESREMGRKWTGYMSNPIILTLMGIVSIVFWGVIKSLVAGMILRKNPPVTIPPATA
jgi:uncharacterized membrane protein YhaH (DUF805 family)